MDERLIILNSSGGGIATTLDSHYYKGQGVREGIEREYVAIAFAWKNSGNAGLSADKKTTPTVMAARNGEPAVVVLNDQGGGVMDVSDKAGTLRAQEHGHQPIACYALKGNFIDRETQQNGIGWSEGVEFTLDATDRHGVCYTVDCRNLNLNEEKSGTLQSKNQGGHSLNYQNPVLIEVEEK